MRHRLTRLSIAAGSALAALVLAWSVDAAAPADTKKAEAKKPEAKDAKKPDPKDAKKAVKKPEAKKAEPADLFARDVRPLAVKYCVGCHNEKVKKGGVNLERHKSGAEVLGAAERWEAAAHRIAAGDMPPPGKPAPTAEEKAAMLGGIKTTLKALLDCNQLATDKTQNFYRGYVMSRRLTRAEINNGIRDLLGGTDFRLIDDLPSDGAGGEGFDTNGGSLYTSPILLERMLAVADLVVRAVLPAAGEKSPLSAAELKAARAALLIAAPGAQLPAKDAARKVLAGFARKAYRRPLADGEVDRLVALFEKSAARGEPFEQALRTPLKSVLISPHFLFLSEPDPNAEGIHKLPAHPLAARLSAFLWASIPDEELSALADSGKLNDDAVLKEQVKRMLRDPKARGLAETFAVQWLDIEKLGGSVKPDAKKFPEFDAGLADLMKAEAVAYFDRIVRGDRSLLELLDSDYAMLNDRLARHYGVPGVAGADLRPVVLPDRTRGGLLGMGAVLTTTSLSLRTSPVLRGRWVMEELLGSKIPPPPPNVPELPHDDKDTDALTFRQRLEKHRTSPECASCHSRMDPIGFGLENFDAVGRWRTEAAGKPLDAGGVLPSGEKFSGPAELKTVLLKRKNEFLKTVSRKMLGYALGRELNRFDLCVVDQAVKDLSAAGFKPSVLVEKIVLSFPFRNRYYRLQ